MRVYTVEEKWLFFICCIGQTKQKLRNRLSNHKSNIKNKYSHTCELARHALEEGHKFDFNFPHILATEPSEKKRLLLETVRTPYN